MGIGSRRADLMLLRLTDSRSGGSKMHLIIVSDKREEEQDDGNQMA